MQREYAKTVNGDLLSDGPKNGSDDYRNGDVKALLPEKSGQGCMSHAHTTTMSDPYWS